jgi:glycosyltransferase involved in cell wall biosynthesis
MKLVQVFNRYLHPGGEEKSVDRIHHHLSYRHEISRCFYDSATWKSPAAPPAWQQARLLFGNAASVTTFEEHLRQQRPQAALFHNLYPIGSPWLYRSAQQQRLPVIQYLHNFRPFSPGGTLYCKGRLMPEALRGNYWPEVRAGSWQGSRLKTALFALMLKRLHRSGWLSAVHQWVAISDFMRQRLVEAGLPAERIQTLRHSWDALPQPPDPMDDGSYLYLGRWVEEKGLMPLIAAWQQLYQVLGHQTPLLKIAGEGPLATEIQQAALDHPKIQLLGQVAGTHKAELLQQCRAIIVPSLWWEPLGIVVYEAYDHQKPMLAARSGGLTETVHHEKTGWLHQPGATPELVSHVLACESMSSDQRFAMGREGRAWLLRETRVDQWQDRFDSILAQAVA